MFISTTGHLLTNQGNQFCIGIMRDPLFNDDCSDCLFTIIIGTESTSPVSFSFTFLYPKNVVYHTFYTLDHTMSDHQTIIQYRQVIIFIEKKEYLFQLMEVNHCS